MIKRICFSLLICTLLISLFYWRSIIPSTLPVKPDSAKYKYELSNVSKTKSNNKLTKLKRSLIQEDEYAVISQNTVQQEDEVSIIYNGFRSPYAANRITAMDNAIAFENTDSRMFEDDIIQLIYTESDNEVIEAALSYLSFTNSPNSIYSIQYLLERSNLSVDVLAYIGEILYEDYKVEKDSVTEMIVNSQAYAKFDNVEVARLSDMLEEVLSTNQDEPLLQ